jgi:hypothetical protein
MGLSISRARVEFDPVVYSDEHRLSFVRWEKLASDARSPVPSGVRR